MDSAIELHRNVPETFFGVVELDAPAPHEVLGVSEDADAGEIRAAYRRKALAAHPDKGGDPTEFHRIRQAYLTLSGQLTPEQLVPGSQLALPSTGPCEPCRDFQLKNHKDLVKLKFKEDGVDIEACVKRMRAALADVGLQDKECGATNTNETGELIYNQCFYLSLARTYLAQDDRQAIKDAALNFKRAIEAAVLAEHADWAGERVGEDVQAFSDFLVFVLGSDALFSELGVAIFDSVAGGVEVYLGRNFPSRGREEEQRHNLLTVVYVPGHYQALIPKSKKSKPSFRELRAALEKHSVQYVETYV